MKSKAHSFFQAAWIKPCSPGTTTHLSHTRFLRFLHTHMGKLGSPLGYPSHVPTASGYLSPPPVYCLWPRWLRQFPTKTSYLLHSAIYYPQWPVRMHPCFSQLSFPPKLLITWEVKSNFLCVLSGYVCYILDPYFLPFSHSHMTWSSLFFFWLPSPPNCSHLRASAFPLCYTGVYF